MAAPGSHTLALIGFGTLAQGFYAPILRRHPAWRIVAVADPLAAARHAAAAAFPGVDAVAEPSEALAVAPDAVLVASPPSTHLAIWNAAAARGIRTFLEKPFVLPGERARAAPDPAGLLTVNLNRRYWPPYQRLRAAVAEGRLGALRNARFRLHVPVAAWSAVTSHRRDPREGGVLADLGSQLADLAHWMVGGLEGTLEASVSPERAHATLERAVDGATIEIDAAYGDRAAESVRLVGDRGTLEMSNPNLSIRNGNQSALAHWVGDALAVAPRLLRPARSLTRYTLAASLGGFLDAGGSPERVGRTEAEAHVAFLERVLEAAA